MTNLVTQGLPEILGVIASDIDLRRINGNLGCPAHVGEARAHIRPTSSRRKVGIEELHIRAAIA